MGKKVIQKSSRARNYFPFVVVFALLASILAMVFFMRFFENDVYAVHGVSMEPLMYDGDIIALSNQQDEVKVGDVVVFRPPDWPNSHLRHIKTVEGIPGDVITLKNGILDRNENIIATFDESFKKCEMSDSFSHTLSEGEYFVLGKNLDDSVDSLSWLCLGEGEPFVSSRDIVDYGSHVEVVHYGQARTAKSP